MLSVRLHRVATAAPTALIVLVLTLFVSLPLYSMVVTAIKTDREIYDDFTYLPKRPTLVGPLGVSSRPSTDILAIEDEHVARALRYIRARACEGMTVKELLESLQYYAVTWPIARLAGLLKRDFSKKGISLATTDVTIAAVAIYHQLTLMTDNLKHYPMKELNLYSWPQ